MKRVSGEMTLRWTVTLPDNATPVVCEDPAVEAAMQCVATDCMIHLWGPSHAPALVQVELQEEDVVIVEDGREGQ